MIIRADKSENTYKRVCMDFAADTRLSWEARGVMAYLLSKSDNWRIIPADLANQTKAGRDKIYRILNELREAGYLTRTYQRDEHGKVLQVEYQLTEKPEVVDEPFPALPFTAQPFTANPTLPKEDRVPTGDLDLKERGADAPPAERQITQKTDTPRPNTNQPDQPARTPTPQRSAPPPAPVEVAQPRLVEAEQADPVAIYREVAGVKKPNQAQRDAIRARVTCDFDLWRAECERFARNGYNVRKVDNIIDGFTKASAQRAAKARADAARQAEPAREPLLPPVEQRRPVSREEFLKAKAAYYGQGSPFHSLRAS